MYIMIIYLPLMSAAIAGLWGRGIGGEGAKRLTTSLIMITAIISVMVFYEVVLKGAPTYINLWSWFTTGGLILDWGLNYDGLTAVMLIVVTGVSSIVHLYSTEYMKEDPHLPRFMSYLSLFTFFMLILVTGSNYVQIFIGWEGVGLCSYLLINFWYTRIQANKAAIKAMVVNRIGDAGLAVGMFMIIYTFGSLDFAVIYPMTSIIDETSLTIIGVCLIIGAVGKSAQIGLHTWLPDAMEGPTPVSALIHAATMVTAGVYLIIRSSPIIEYSSVSLTVLTIIGALTALMAATIGLVQNDIKKVIAYSTCSQLGYMVFACGISNYSVSLFHLMNHAFFKALLFLSAGAVIHAMSDEQDMRKLGGLIKSLPMTYSLMLIGSLSLMGFPFLTGFYSKDAILEFTFASYTITSTFAYWLGAFSALCTSFYSFRLLINSFLSNPRSSLKFLESAHEAPMNMSISLIILGIGSIFIGYILKDAILGLGTPALPVFILPTHLSQISGEFLSPMIKFLPVILSMMGAAGALILYVWYPSAPYSRPIYVFLSNKWHFDAIYNNYVVRPLFRFALNVTYKVLDKGLIEWAGPTGISRIITSISLQVSHLQSGQVYNYALAILIFTSLFALPLPTTDLFFLIPLFIISYSF